MYQRKVTGNFWVMIPVFCFTGLLIYASACGNKRYPCPATSSSTQARIDTSGTFAGGYKHSRDPKTGLIKKKKNKKLYDKRGNAKVF